MSATHLPFREIAILGPGLLGTSLALALQGKAQIRLWGRNSATIADLSRQNAASFCTTELAAAVAGADLVIFCTPIGVMGALAAQLLPFLGKDAVVTDVGSVKTAVVAELAQILGAERFIGSHPMAGSEQSGSAAAKADLFLGAACILTPTSQTPNVLTQRLQIFWESLGCEVHRLTPEAHDRQIALISHLPHLLAGCLVNTAGDAEPNPFRLAGQGFRDSTRIASGPPEMWSGILRGNRGEILLALESLQTHLARAGELLRADDEAGLRALLSVAKTRRDGIIRKERYGGN